MIRTAKEAMADERANNILPKRPIGWPLEQKQFVLFDYTTKTLLWAISTFKLVSKYDEHK